jgi:hypothetical protein
VLLKTITGLMTPDRSAALLIALSSTLACSKDPATATAALDAGVSSANHEPSAPRPSAEALAGEATTTTSALATMKLVDRGRAPRRKLRYRWRVDHKERLVMDLRTQLSTESDDAKQPEIPLPPVHVIVDIDAQGVWPDGDLQYAWRVASSSVPAGDPHVPPYVADGMRTEVATIARLSGTAVVTSRGLAKEVSIDPGSVTDAGGTGRMVEQMRQQLRDLAAPLPEEDVGVGARWQKLSQLAEKDARVTQTDTFTLVDLDADRGVLDDMLAQTAPPQPLRGPAAPQGAQPQMESMLASGDAKTRFDLSRLVPQTNFDGTTTMVISGQSPDDTSRRMTMVMRMGIVLSGSTR